MALSTNDLRNGMALDLSEGLFVVVEFQHVKPGKGGAFVRTKLRNMRTKAVIERTFRADERVEQALIEKKEMQFLYRDSEQYVFMDSVSYDQLHVDESSLGHAASYLKEGDSAVLQTYDDEIGGRERAHDREGPERERRAHDTAQRLLLQGVVVDPVVPGRHGANLARRRAEASAPAARRERICGCEATGWVGASVARRPQAFT